jgi:LssY C-terminus
VRIATDTRPPTAQTNFVRISIRKRNDRKKYVAQKLSSLPTTLGKETPHGNRFVFLRKIRLERLRAACPQERLCWMSWTKRFALPVCTLFLLLPHALSSQGLPAAPAELFLPSGTPVELQSVQTISSARAHKGDRVDFVVAKDVQAAGFTIIGAGARAQGSIIGVKGKRPLGMGGDVIIKLDSVELATGDSVALVARKEFKGKSHTIRMGVAMAIAAAIYLPAAPAFVLSRGRDSTVLKGTELTAYTRTDSPVEIAGLPPARENVSELSEMIKMLPSRVTNAEGREGDMLNLIFQAREEDLQEAFAQAGWLKVEKSKRLIFWHLLWQRGHYTKLPMDRLYALGGPRITPTRCRIRFRSLRGAITCASGKPATLWTASRCGWRRQRTMSRFIL